ncbi:MAG: hypothetical protein JXA50_01545 [Deltaproteobacteria bacterium]|nr:hypothetical protein [Deltaproteobacteria bacterium]
MAGKICPFLSASPEKPHRECVREGCALWLESPNKKGDGACSLLAIAARFNTPPERFFDDLFKRK